VRSLPLFHRVAGQPVIVLGEGAGAEAKRRLVERTGGIVVDETDQRARLAFIATDEPEAAAERLRARGVLVNVTDRPELCDFTVPSVVYRDPVLVAVGTGGASAGLAKHLRLRLERLLPANLGRLADALYAARAKLQAQWPDPAQRRGALDRALAEGGTLDPMAWSGGDVHLTGPAEAGAEPVELVIASGDPDDLTLRQARLLGLADAVLFESDVPQAILERARADAVRVALPHGGELPTGLVLVLRLG
jgi:uroporphyrin-III C-methyltransferase/precorrin-2 dehydrogenase/sirohydrochlorin ferrochelatase